MNAVKFGAVNINSIRRGMTLTDSQTGRQLKVQGWRRPPLVPQQIILTYTIPGSSDTGTKTKRYYHDQGSDMIKGLDEIG